MRGSSTEQWPNFSQYKARSDAIVTFLLMIVVIAAFLSILHVDTENVLSVNAGREWRENTKNTPWKCRLCVLPKRWQPRTTQLNNNNNPEDHSREPQITQSRYSERSSVILPWVRLWAAGLPLLSSLLSAEEPGHGVRVITRSYARQLATNGSLDMVSPNHSELITDIQVRHHDISGIHWFQRSQ